MARDLGFAAITRNSMDVSADRDFALDFLYAASTTMLHLSRLAEDWILYSSEEFGWLELGDGVTSGSSLMPQKKNPDSLELIRGKSGRVFGALSSLFVDDEGSAHDLQPRHAGGQGAAVRRGRSTVRVARNGARGRRSAKLNAQHPAAAAEESWVVATDLAEALARNGTPFHQAHQIVGTAGARERSRRQEARGLDRRRAGEVRARVHSGDGWAAATRRGHEDARDSRRHGSQGRRGCFEGSRSAPGALPATTKK